MLSWKDLAVPIVGCHLASSFRNKGPFGDLAQLILIYRIKLCMVIHQFYLKHLLEVYMMLGSTGASSFIKHCLLVTMLTWD